MNEAESRSSISGLIILFVVLTLVGVILSYFYIFFQANIHHIWINIIAVIVTGGILAGVVWIIKRSTKITNNVLSVIVTALSLTIIVYVMWNMWFVIMAELIGTEGSTTGLPREMHMFADFGEIISRTWELVFARAEFTTHLREFNALGTWSISYNDNGDYNVWTGVMLYMVWAGELIIIVSLPLLAAYAAVGLFVTELNAWVDEKLMNYGFTAFDDYELDKLASGDINAILEKPLEARNGPMSAVAVCYHRGDPTEFIAVYKAHWDKDGALSKGRHIMTVRLGLEKIDALDVGLQAKHYPAPVKKEAPVEAPTGDMAAAIFEQYSASGGTSTQRKAAEADDE